MGITNEQAFRIGMELHSIACLVDDETLEKIKPHLDKIEQTVKESMEGDDAKCRDTI